VSPAAARVYVYYRIRAENAADVIAAVGAMQRQLQAALPGLVCSLSRRAENHADALTLMETYGHAEGIDSAWRLEIERRAREVLATWIVGERHVEVFEPCA